jgi:hypothetical protein
VENAGDAMVAQMAAKRIEELNKTFGIMDKTISPTEAQELSRAATNPNDPNKFITLSKELSKSGREI